MFFLNLVILLPQRVGLRISKMQKILIDEMSLSDFIIL